MTAKDYPSAEKPLKCALATSGNPLVQYGLATYWLGTALYTQHKAAEGMFEIARAVDGVTNSEGASASWSSSVWRLVTRASRAG